MRTIAVVGGLAAGPAAAAEAARSDPSADVVLIEAGPHIAYGICELPYVVSGVIPDPAVLVPFTPEAFTRTKRVRVLIGQRAVTLDRAAQRLGLRDQRGGQREQRYDALVLATGSAPRRPSSGATHTLKTIAGAVALRDQIRGLAGGRGAVLGAGYVGLEAAEALSRAGLRVTIFDREQLPLGGFEEPCRRVMAGELAEAGVELVGGVEITTGVVEKSDVVVAALGVEPVVELAQASGIAIGPSGAIQVDERGQTSDPRVFAAGDCAETGSVFSLRRGPLALATVAYRTGRIAGANAAGGNVRRPPLVGALAFSAFGLEIGRMGLSADDARRAGMDAVVSTLRSTNRVAALPGAEPILITIVAERATGRLLGANVLGAEGAALRLNLLAALAARGATVAEVAQLDLAYGPTYSLLRDPVQQAAAAAERERRGG